MVEHVLFRVTLGPGQRVRVYVTGSPVWAYVLDDVNYQLWKSGVPATGWGTKVDRRVGEIAPGVVGTFNVVAWLVGSGNASVNVEVVN